ncbi:MAG TPA: hypothetical protein VFB96_21510 [Pirellulaceae bacterium]|nr:hypothetical protein [Pirellulaceae bacterium]
MARVRRQEAGGKGEVTGFRVQGSGDTFLTPESWLLTRFLCLLLALASSGCRGFHAGQPPAQIENPLFVPAMDRELLWNQTVDAVDDYFRIEREERVRLTGGVLTEGRIDTFPTTGSTLLEPWRGDSTRGYEKWHATLQSIRRRGIVRVIPSEGGYLIDVQILKELEDLDKPEHATAGGATMRHDGSLVRQEGASGRFSHTLGWIPLGRDVSLEQQILADLTSRLHLPTSGWSLPAGEMFEPTRQHHRAEELPPPLEELRPLPQREELPPSGGALELFQP